MVAVGVGVVVGWPALAVAQLPEARLALAPDGVLFLIQEGVRYRVTPAQMSYAELGAIQEGPPLAAGSIAARSAGPTAGSPRVVRPAPGMGLSREEPIPLGWTCSCTIDRSGLISQFDITVASVVPDAYPLVLRANRFNKPPREGAAYVGVLVDMKYIRGPEDQAYSVAESDYHASAGDEKLRDPATLIGFSEPFAPSGTIPGGPVPRLRADVYPGSTLTAWVFFELPRGQAGTVVWEYSFVGERGVWFALQ